MESQGDGAMRFHLLSDLHLEFERFTPPPVNADCVIFAGDVHCKRNGVRWIREAVTDKPVVYVLGNHEYYGEKMPGLAEKLKADAAGADIHVLENNWVEIAGISIFGCTLWTDMMLHGELELASYEAATQMNDYRKIRSSVSYQKLRPTMTRGQHAVSIRTMKDFFAQNDPRRSVVVTHHAPSMRSLPEHRRDRLISGAYASNLEPLIEQFAPLVWVHGHIHHPVRYRVGKTLVLSNPRGYPDEGDRGFQPDLVVDTEALEPE